MSQVAVIQQGPVLAMSSREIAALVESRHDNVKRTIERLGEKGSSGLLRRRKPPTLALGRGP